MRVCQNRSTAVMLRRLRDDVPDPLDFPGCTNCYAMQLAGGVEHNEMPEVQS